MYLKMLKSFIYTICLLYFVDHCYAQNAAGISSTQQLNNSGGRPGSLRSNGMSFTQNKGQVADLNGNQRPDVLFKGGGGGTDVYIRKTGISYVLSNMNEVMHEIDEQVEKKIKSGEITEQDERKVKQELSEKQQMKLHRIDVDFVGGTQNPEIKTADQVDGYTNYYLGHCPQGITNVNSYNEVTQKNIYRNIDVKYFGGKQQGLKYDIVVNPGADPNQIKLKYSGAKSVQLKNSRLQIETELGQMKEYIPKVYQNINGKIVDVKTEYVLSYDEQENPIIHFSFSIFNSSFPLVVDPWATYYGGNQWDLATSIATDNLGNVVITGWTDGGTFPVSVGAQQTIYVGLWDAFVVKFSPAGARIWATYYGGDQQDQGIGIATDNLRNVVITGYTAGGTFPISLAAQQLIYGGWKDAFVVKFSPAGVRIWATYYGGDKNDMGAGIATDKLDNVVITGYTWGGTFPVGSTPPNVVQQSFFGGWPDDAFVVKFSPAGAMLWATYYGGDQLDQGMGIATDNLDNVLITGYTYGGTFPVSAGAQQTIFGGGFVDAFVVKFSPTGAMLWATYFGGDQRDFGNGIATDNLGNVVITGWTQGGTFPIGFTPGNVVQQPIYGGGAADAFVVKFSPAGVGLWATYYGGNQLDWGFNVACDANNNVYLLMEVEDVASPSLIDACTWQSVFNGGSSVNIPGNHVEVEDQTIVKFSHLGKKLCATYMGGTGEDDLDTGGNMIAIFGNSLYICGYTDGGYPVTPGVAQTVFGGGIDAFVASICTNICEGKILGLNYTANATNVCANAPVTFTPSIVNSCDTTGYKFHWVFTGGNPASSDSVKPTVLFPGLGTHDVKLVVTTICKKDSITKPAYITVTPCTTTCTLTAQYIKGTANCAGCGCKEWIMVNASNGTSPYNYLWPDGYDKRYKNKLCPNTYTIKVTDKNTCTVNVVINAP
jgi:hypothetical protein